VKSMLFGSFLVDISQSCFVASLAHEILMSYLCFVYVNPSAIKEVWVQKKLGPPL
jgi:hypothetical protein